MLHMDNFRPLAPVNFFQIGFDCRSLDLAGGTPFALSQRNYRKHMLPDTSPLTHESAFASVALGWSEEGLEIFADVAQRFEDIAYPQFRNGDSLEVCVDTRDVKTSGYNTRFCHHFFFLPKAFEGRQAGEITRFRTEDAHELCNPGELRVGSQLKAHGYCLQAFIPATCLHGYDPAQFDRIGFTYRLNRADGLPQHFSVLSDDYQMEQQPSLWSSGRLIK